jgi:opacity protein-like surface antigen
MKTLRLILLTLIIYSPCFSVKAQTVFKRFALEPVAGITYPNSDPTPKATLTYGVGFRYTLSPLLSFNLGYNYGTWQSGKDLIGREFKTYFYLIAIRSQVNLGELFHFDQVTRKFHPFVSIGYGRIQAMASNIREREKVTKVARDFSGNVNAFPVGMGIRFLLSARLDLTVNAEYLLHSSDSLDGHSLDMRLYNVRNNPDYAWFFTTSVSYKFGTKKQKGSPHLEWHSPRLQEKSEITQLANENYAVKMELDSLKQVVRFLEDDYHRMDTLLQALSGSKDSLQRTITILESQSSKIDSMRTTMPDSTVTGIVQTNAQGIPDTTLVEIIFRAFESQSARSDSLAQALFELQDKMNFFLLGYTPKYGRVKAMTDLKLREMVPNTKARIIKVIPAGTAIEFTGFVSKGELIEGNPNWYKDVFGNYFWAGHTSQPWPEEK